MEQTMERITVTIPRDLNAYLIQRKTSEGIPISVQVRRAIERDVMDRAEAKAKQFDRSMPEPCNV